MKKEKWFQQMHKDCGGEIIVVGNRKKEWHVICKVCNKPWVLKTPMSSLGELPKEFIGCQF